MTLPNTSQLLVCHNSAYLVCLDNPGNDAATDRDITSERAFFVDVVSLDCLTGGLRHEAWVRQFLIHLIIKHLAGKIASQRTLKPRPMFLYHRMFCAQTQTINKAQIDCRYHQGWVTSLPCPASAYTFLTPDHQLICWLAFESSSQSGPP